MMYEIYSPNYKPFHGIRSNDYKKLCNMIENKNNYDITYRYQNEQWDTVYEIIDRLGEPDKIIIVYMGD